MSIAQIEKDALSVVSMLEKAKTWVESAMDLTGPDEIVAAKAQIRTAESYAKELGLSREIRDDAAEMARRIEYGLGKAIRRGQAEGTIATAQEAQAMAGRARQLGVAYADLPEHKPSPTDYMPRHEWNNSQADIQDLADADPETFDAALADAREEGNLSRANVARKVAERTGGAAEPSPAANPTERAHQEAELINAFASIVRRSLTPKNIRTLSPKARTRLIALLENAITSLKGNES